MEIRYNNSIEDLVALQKVVVRRSSISKKIVKHRFVTMEIILLLLCLLFIFNNPVWKVLLAFVFLSVLMWLFRERSVVLQFKKDLKKEMRRDTHNSLLAERQLKISPDGIEARMEARISNFTWDQVEYINHDDQYLYFVMKGLLHFIIPKSAFADEAQLNMFLEALQGCKSLG